MGVGMINLLGKATTGSQNLVTIWSPQPLVAHDVPTLLQHPEFLATPSWVLCVHFRMRC